MIAVGMPKGQSARYFPAAAECGWLAPTNAFNKGMEASYKNRKEFKIKEHI